MSRRHQATRLQSDPDPDLNGKPLHIGNHSFPDLTTTPGRSRNFLVCEVLEFISGCKIDLRLSVRKATSDERVVKVSTFILVLRVKIAGPNIPRLGVARVKLDKENIIGTFQKIVTDIDR